MTEQPRAIDEMNPDGVPRKVLFVAGAGRSGTSTLAGIVSRLGMHVPLPEVPPDDSNPRGFSEPQWVVDVHDEWLAEALVQVSDSRPNAWFDTGRICSREPARMRVSEWLEPHFAEHPELVVKDPRLSWFLGLWRVGAIRTGATPVFATMLRPPAEVVGSKQKYYANKLGSAHLAASWVNMLLHTERATRPAEGDGGRVFVRYEDLLSDWVRTTTAMGHALDLQTIIHTRSDQIREVHRFIDPHLRRVTSSLDDLALPRRLHDLTGQTWEELNKLADEGGDTPDAHATFDQLRAAYVEIYEEAEAISRSSAEHARLLARRRALAETTSEPRSLTDRVPHDVRAAIPPSVRRGVRKALGRSRDSAGEGAVTIPIGSGHGLTNLEGHTDFDLVWPWNQPGGLRRGATAVLRVKNEAPGLRFVLPPLLRACDHVLLVDNGSDDGTGEEALRVAAEHGMSHRFTLKEYPFAVARAGGEHLAVNERSVHSLAYFYNWCFSHVRTRYSWKWDGDMVLTTEGEVSMADLSWQVGMAEAVIRFPRHGLYIESESKAYLDLGLRNIEEWGFPMSPDYVYAKAPEWEIRTTPDRIEQFALPQGLCVELKWLDGDEFAHWTNPEAFATSIRNRRKRREWLVWNALHAGEVPVGVVEIVAPEGVHVVDHVTHTWLPRAPRPFVVDDPEHAKLHLRA